MEHRGNNIVRILVLLCFVITSVCSLHAQFYSVQTNLVKAATGSFYLEGSSAAALKWTLHLGVEYNPWTFSDNRKIKNFSVTPGARYWFNQSYMGGFAGVHALYSRYNFTLKEHRYDGNGGGMGLRFGYAIPVGVRWNIEASGGAGFLWGRHEKYGKEVCGRQCGRETRMFLVPGLELNVVYLF